MSQISSNTKQLAASLLGKVVSDLMPDAEILGTAPTPVGFLCEFIYNGVLPEDFSSDIQQRLVMAAKGTPVVRNIEMMRENAAELLSHYGHEHLSERVLQESANIVQLIQIDQFYDMGMTTVPEGFETVRHFWLLDHEVSELEDGRKVVVIEGVIARSQKDLKQLVKAYKNVLANSFELLGEEMKLLIPDNPPLWLPRGATLLNLLKDLWKREYEMLNFSFVDTCSNFPKSDDFQEIYNNLDQFPLKIAECREEDLAHIYCSADDIKEEVISSLHFFLKMINIFNVDYRWVLVIHGSKDKDSRQAKSKLKAIMAEACAECQIEPDIEYDNHLIGECRIEVRLIDSIGREWGWANLELQPLTSKRVLAVQQAFGSLERFIAYLVEQSSGQLPFWLVPEQVRVLSVGEKQISYAREISRQLQANGFRVNVDTRIDPLATKVYDSQRDKVPNIVIVGDKEQKDSVVTVRSGFDKGQDKMVSMCTFLEELRANNVEY